MDNELVTGLESDKGGGGGNTSALFKRYNDAFHKVFPYYLSIGMSAEQFWDGDSELVIAYRQADEYKRRMDNQQAWLIGLYTYKALSCLVPILNPFAKAGTTAEPYISEPINLYGNEEEILKNSNDRARNKALDFMTEAMVQNNRRFNKGE